MESVIAQKLEGPAGDSLAQGDISKQVGISDNLSMVVINDKGASQFWGKCLDSRSCSYLIGFRIIFWIFFILATGVTMDIQENGEPGCRASYNASEKT